MKRQHGKIELAYQEVYLEQVYYIISINTLHHLPDGIHGASEMNRMLRTGCHLSIIKLCKEEKNADNVKQWYRCQATGQCHVLSVQYGDHGNGSSPWLPSLWIKACYWWRCEDWSRGDHAWEETTVRTQFCYSGACSKKVDLTRFSCEKLPGRTCRIKSIFFVRNKCPLWWFTLVHIIYRHSVCQCAMIPLRAISLFQTSARNLSIGK